MINKDLNQNLLISGGTGYLASHLINFLAKDNIFIIDRKIKNNRLILTPKNFIEKNIENLCLTDIPENLDLLIHTSYCKNLEAEKKFLNFAREKNPNLKLVFFSSAAVYGDLYKRRQDIFTSSDAPNPINDYGKYKLEIENFIKTIFQNFQILRISNPYGKEYETRGVYQLFKARIAKSLESNHQASFIINYPQARVMVRDMIFIDDAIQQIVSVLKNKESGIYNISSGKPIYLEDLAYLALKEFCQEHKIETSMFKLNFLYREKPEGEIIQSVLEPIPYELSLQDSYCN